MHFDGIQSVPAQNGYSGTGEESAIEFQGVRAFWIVKCLDLQSKEISRTMTAIWRNNNARKREFTLCGEPRGLLDALQFFFLMLMVLGLL